MTSGCALAASPQRTHSQDVPSAEAERQFLVPRAPLQRLLWGMLRTALGSASGARLARRALCPGELWLLSTQDNLYLLLSAPAPGVCLSEALKPVCSPAARNCRWNWLGGAHL